jgi:hypothetical protein
MLGLLAISKAAVYTAGRMDPYISATHRGIPREA